MEIGVLGATGPAGSGLAARLASAGHDVIAGSRDPTKVGEVVARLSQQWGVRVAGLRGAGNEDAARAADVVVIATRAGAAIATARQHSAALGGKIVITMASGLEKVGREFHALLPAGNSIGRAIQDSVPRARVVAAFQHVPAAAFAQLDQALESDVVVVGDDEGARGVVADLVLGLPDLRAFDCGSLANALGVEAFTAVLLTANVHYRGTGTLSIRGLAGRRPDVATIEQP